MSPSFRASLCALMLLLLLTSAASAQANSAVVTATCNGAGIDVTLALDITAPLPPAWVSWVVDRRSIGPCEDLPRVLGPLPFPAGAVSWSVTDLSVVAGVTYEYIFFALDAQGNRYEAFDGGFANEWTAYSYASCGAAPAIRGLLWGTGGDRTSISMCGEGCWELAEYIVGLPSGLEPLFRTDTIVEIDGKLQRGPEGVYITDVTGWRVVDTCFAVTSETATWGGVKAQYR